MTFAMRSHTNTVDMLLWTPVAISQTRAILFEEAANLLWPKDYPYEYESMNVYNVKTLFNEGLADLKGKFYLQRLMLSKCSLL